MARPARTEEAKIEDAFFDLSPDRQEPLLRMLQRLHELKRRQEPKVEKKADGVAEQSLPMGTG